RDIRVAVVVNRVAAIVEAGADLSVERSDAGTLVVGDQVRFSIAEPANNRGGGRGTHAALQLDATAICRAASRRLAVRQRVGPGPVGTDVIAHDLQAAGAGAIGIPDADAIAVVAGNYVARCGAGTAHAGAADAHAGQIAADAEADRRVPDDRSPA